MENYRHGDLLLKRVDTIPKKVTKVSTLVLAEGETTGHKHRFVGGQVQVFADETQAPAYVQVTKASQLVHEEHKSLDIEEGTYQIVHEREFNPFEEEVRRVMD